MVKIYKNGQWITVAGKSDKEVVSSPRNIFPIVGSEGVVYIATDENKIYRFDTNTHTYVSISASGEIEELIEKIKKLGTHKLSKNANGDNFETEDELVNASVYYYRGEPHIPDENDFAIVNEYGEEGNKQPARFSFDGENWTFDYLLNSLTVEQQEALNSGITETKVALIDANAKTIGELADELNGKFNLISANSITIDDVSVPNLTGGNIDFIKNAFANQKLVRVTTFTDSRYYFDVINAGTDYCLLLSAEGYVVEYRKLTNTIIDIVVRKGGDVPANVETTNNKVTTITSSSTNTQYPSAKAVYNAVQPIKEAVEGKATNYQLSYKAVPPTAQTFDNYTLFREDGTQILTFQDFQNYLISGDKNLCMNSVFGEGKNFIEYEDYDSHYLLVVPDKIPGWEGTPIPSGNFLMVLFFPLNGEYGKLKNGDNILVIEEYNDEGKYIPDYWYGNYSGFHAYNSSDDRNIAKLNTDNTFTGTNTFSGVLGIGTGNIEANSNVLVIRNNSTNMIGCFTDRTVMYKTTIPYNNNAQDLGNSSYKWKDLYLSGTAYVVNIGSSAVNGGKISFFDSGYSTLTGNLYPSVTNAYQLGYAQRVFSKVFTTTLSDGTNEIPTSILIGGVITDSTHTEFVGAFASKNDYVFTQPMTNINASFEVSTGDNRPTWKISFIAGTNLSVTLPNNAVWVDGTPTFTQGEEFTILVEKSVIAEKYKVYLIRG